MRILSFLLLVILFSSPATAGQGGGPEGKGLLQVAEQLRSDQIRVKDLSLRIIEILLGAAADITPEEKISLERVNQRLGSIGSVASYEASRLEMLWFVRDEHRPRFAQTLASELQATAEALSVDESIARDQSRKWSAELQGRIGLPDETIAGIRRRLEAAIAELKKLGGQTI